MPWQVPIYDRTETDVKAKADKCYFSAAMLNRIEGNLAYLADLFGVTIQTKTWASTDFLTPSQMQRILANLKTVRDAYNTLPGTPEIPDVYKRQDVTDADGTVLGTVRLNLADAGLMGRFEEARRKIEAMVQDAGADANPDTMIAVDKAVKEQLDYAFGAEVSPVFFGGMSSLALCEDGELVDVYKRQYPYCG